MSGTTKARELRERRANLINNARLLSERAESEGRDLNAEERAEYDGMWSDINDLQSRADRLDREAEVMRGLEVVGEPAARADSDDVRGDLERRLEAAGVRPSIRRAFAGINPDRRTAAPAYADAFERYAAQGEARDLTMGTDPKGGYLVPDEFMAMLLEKTRDSVVVEAFATNLMVDGAQSLGIPTLETRPDDADWTSELATGSEDSSMAFGKRQLNPNPLAKRIKVSRTLLRRSPMGAAGIVLDNMGYKFSITREKAFLTGNGASQPLGLFTASADGIDTSRDVSTDNTTTAITADGLKRAKWSLKPGYVRNARWIFHRDAMSMIDRLKDGEGRYLLQPDVRGGTGDVLLGRPVLVSEYAPNTFTSGNYVGMIGDLSYYYIADALGFTVQRLEELYAETNQIGFIGRAEVDAMPVFAEAFARVTLA